MGEVHIAQDSVRRISHSAHYSSLALLVVCALSLQGCEHVNIPLAFLAKPPREAPTREQESFLDIGGFDIGAAPTVRKQRTPDRTLDPGWQSMLQMDAGQQVELQEAYDSMAHLNDPEAVDRAAQSAWQKMEQEDGSYAPRPRVKNLVLSQVGHQVRRSRRHIPRMLNQPPPASVESVEQHVEAKLDTAPTGEWHPDFAD
mmetsp:Transcript_12298/g.33785  ORF Transcript_12298/g.33785 Transcript_12298/m.33785 type:complete len:200 (-) Transcript_12298:67-666(-)